MLIGIEAERANQAQKTGVEHYAKELILQFAKLTQPGSVFWREAGDPLSLKFVLYLRTEPEDWIKDLPENFSYKVMPFTLFWTQLRLSFEMIFHAPDVLFIPASAIPLVCPEKTFCTVHDAAFLFYPESFTRFMRNFLHYSYIYIKLRAKSIIAVSKATADDLVTHYGVKPEKISIIHHGYTPQEKEYTQELSANLAAIELPPRYILFLSTLQPRKNLARLIDAVKLLRTKHRGQDIKLVVAGKVGWKAEGILQKIEQNSEFVVYLNHVTDEQRTLLYSRAEALAIPSLYEGFGMWLLEAFDAGVPVITSKVSSMPEVAGEAAEYCEPTSIESIEQAMEKVLFDPERRTVLVELGKLRLKNFSWQKCAEETLRLILK